MKNLREVNDDILKDWLMFREEDLSSLTCDEDKNIGFILMRFLREFCRMFQNRIKSMLRNNLNCLMRILWIIFFTGMKSIIGMGLWMVLR